MKLSEWQGLMALLRFFIDVRVLDRVFRFRASNWVVQQFNWLKTRTKHCHAEELSS